MSFLQKDIAALDAARRGLYLGRRQIPDTSVAFDVHARVERSSGLERGKPWIVRIFTPKSGISAATYAFRTKAEAFAWLAANEQRLREQYVERG